MFAIIICNSPAWLSSNLIDLSILIINQYTIYSVEGEWEYFFAHFRKGIKSFKKGLRMKFGYLEGQFIDFMEDSGGCSWFWKDGGLSTIQKY